MSVFNEYARYYDLLYRDKDYRGEAEYVHNLIQAYVPGARTILNLGCGSGRHDRELEKRGYQITGVDLSVDMLSSAKASAAGNKSLEYVPGDVRSIRFGETFDVVISLFHVMSYQIKNEDLLAAFETAYCHLKPAGVFLFDCWYGPGVLSDRPAERLKELEDDLIKLVRVAEPVMHPNENVVDVNYHVSITNKSTGEMRDIRESHRMRYLFMPEVQHLLSLVGFESWFSEEWMTGLEPGFRSWNVTFVAINKAL